MNDALAWLRDRVLTEHPGAVLDVGGDLVPRLKLPADPNLTAYAIGKPEHPAAFDKIVTRGRWPRVDVVLLTLSTTPDQERQSLLDRWDRARKAARKTLLASVAFGAGTAFTSDIEVHRVLPGIVASDGLGHYAVTPLGFTG